jgi:thioredoxin-dependent peroxiredoxin
MTMPALTGDAPPFELKDQNGDEVTLRDLKGQWIVLYFYPRDDTAGCTKEACSFRDNYESLQAMSATVLGVSGDSASAHRKFAAKHNLPFRLLVDEDHSVARAYGAWGTKNMYGRQYEGILRSTFIIGPDGKIAAMWPKVKPDGHGDEVLSWLEEHARK